MSHRRHRDTRRPARRDHRNPTGACPIPWWTRGDTNAFFGLGFNILVNVLTLTGLMIGVVNMPAGDVLGTVLPALGVALILGNLYYMFLARRLARARTAPTSPRCRTARACRTCSSSCSWSCCRST